MNGVPSRPSLPATLSAASPVRPSTGPCSPRFRRSPLLALSLALVPLATVGCGPEDSAALESGAAPSVDASLAVVTSSQEAAPVVAATSPEAAGRYLVVVGGCNDCHTDGWMATDGGVPETAWLTGSVVGFRGPWGTSYPSNLRLSVQEREEAAWIEMVRTRRALPPMPWMNVRQLSDDDLRAIYAYLRSLEPAGSPAPAALPPGEEPTGPWFDFVPKNLPATAG